MDTGDVDTEDVDTGEPVDDEVDHEVSVVEEEDGSITVVLPFEEEAEFTVGIETEVQKLDVAFLLDTTSSMTDEAAAMAAEFSGIVDDISTTIEDAAYGFALSTTTPLARWDTPPMETSLALRHQITGSSPRFKRISTTLRSTLAAIPWSRPWRRCIRVSGTRLRSRRKQSTTAPPTCCPLLLQQRSL